MKNMDGHRDHAAVDRRQMPFQLSRGHQRNGGQRHKSTDRRPSRPRMVCSPSFGGALLAGYIGIAVSLTILVMVLPKLGAARTGSYIARAPFIAVISATLLGDESINLSIVLATMLMGLGVALNLTQRLWPALGFDLKPMLQRISEKASPSARPVTQVGHPSLLKMTRREKPKRHIS